MDKYVIYEVVKVILRYMHLSDKDYQSAISEIARLLNI